MAAKPFRNSFLCKTALVCAMLFVCVFLACYYHFIPRIEIVYTHVFYIPIILSCFWWRRKGIFAAAFLAGILLFAHIVSRSEVSIIPDAARAFMFVFVGAVTALISEKKQLLQDKLKAEKELQQSFQIQDILNELLNISLKDIPLQQVLEQAIDQIVSTPWFVFEKKGIIFVVGGNNKGLIMTAQRGLSRHAQAMCANISAGRCLCGMAAESGGIIHADFVDERHEILYEGIKPHGHYCIPIISANGDVLGVITVYLAAGHKKDDREVEFLRSVASVLAGIIERKKTEALLRESEEKYRTVVESAQDAIIMADAETGVIIDTNKKAEEMLGMPRENIVGLHQSEIHPKEDAELYKIRFADRVKRGANFTSVAYARNRRGYNIPVQINTNFIEIKGKKIVLGIFRDITDLKKTEEVLRKEKIGLEKIAGEKTIELRMALKELEDAKRLSDIGTLAATIAHELRNPLGVIGTAVYNIKSKNKDPSLEGHIATINKKILESDQIIKNLLFYSKIKMPHYENTAIHDILKDGVKYCEEKYSKLDVTITEKCDCEECGVIEADPLQITEVFLNILDNAYQSFQDKKGNIKVTVECDKRQNRVDISVSDDGAGIDKEDLPNVFNQFFTTKARGTGLGLTVCKQIINLHGGEIKIESEKDKGTTVYVSLPMKRG